MNLGDFATVLTAILRHDEALVDAGGRHTELIVPMAWGDPGVGKTEIVEAVAGELGYGLVYADLATRDPAELGGLPWVEDGRSIRCRPDWLPTRGQGHPVPRRAAAGRPRQPQHRGDADPRAPDRRARAGRRAGWWSAPATTRATAPATTSHADATCATGSCISSSRPMPSAGHGGPAARRLDPVLIAYNRYRAASTITVSRPPTTPTRRRGAGCWATMSSSSSCRPRSSRNACEGRSARRPPPTMPGSGGCSPPCPIRDGDHRRSRGSAPAAATRQPPTR